MALNVTTSSALIGCDFREQQYFKSTRENQQDESLKQQNSELSYRFSIQVYKIPSSFFKTNNNANSEVPDQSDESINLVSKQATTYLGFTSAMTTTNNNNAGQQIASEQHQLEANLTSALLREPIFLLNNLQASTSYALHVRSLDTSGANLALLEPGSVVRFSTSTPQEAPSFQDQSSAISYSSNSSTFGTNNNNKVPSSYPRQKNKEPRVEPVIEAHQSQKLLSALISTRSTNQFNGKEHQYPSNHLNHRNSSRAKIYQQQQKQTGILDKLWGSTNSFFDTVFGMFKVDNNNNNNGNMSSAYSSSTLPLSTISSSNRPPASSKQITNSRRTNTNNSQLMEASNVYLIASVCLVLIASLSFVLFVHRYSGKLSCFSYHSDKESLGDNSLGHERKLRSSFDNFRKRSDYESYSMSACAESSPEQARSNSKESQANKYKEGTNFPGSISSNVDSESSLGVVAVLSTAKRFTSNIDDAVSSSSLLVATSKQQKNLAKSRSSLCLESLPVDTNNSAPYTSYTTRGAAGGRLISDANSLLNNVSCGPNSTKNISNTNTNNNNNNASDSREHFSTNCAATSPSYPVSSTFLLSSSSSASNYAQGKDKYDEREGSNGHALVVHDGDYYDRHLRQRELSHLNSESSSLTSTMNNRHHHHQHQHHNHHQQHQLQHQQIHENKRYGRAAALIGYNGNTGSSSIIETSDALYMSNRGILTNATAADHFSSCGQTNINRAPSNEMEEEVAVEAGLGVGVGVGANKHLLNVFVMQSTTAETATTMTTAATTTTGQTNAIKRPASNCSRKIRNSLAIEQQQASCQSSSLISNESSDCTWSPASCILGNGANFTLSSCGPTNNDQQIDCYSHSTPDQQGLHFIKLIPATTKHSSSSMVAATALSNSENSSFSDVNLMNKMLVHESSCNSLQQQQQLLNLLNTAPGQHLLSQEAPQFNTCLSFTSPGTSLNSANSSSANGDQTGLTSPPLTATNTSLQNEEQPPILLLHRSTNQLIEQQQNQPDYKAKPNQQSGNLYSRVLPSILKNSSANHHQQQHSGQLAVCLCNGKARGNEEEENVD